ncbi:MAG: hypothetical protein ACREJO_08045 [Phycisphaerales bacterium]
MSTALALTLALCTTFARAQDAEPTFQFTVPPGRVWAVPGEPLVIPLNFGDTLRKGGPVRLESRNGAKFSGFIAWYTVTREPNGWMQASGVWRSGESREVGVQGFWGLVCTPPSAAKGADLVLMGQPIALEWSGPPPAPGDAPWRQFSRPSGPSDPALPASLESALRQAARSPLDAWRAELLLPAPPDDAPGVLRREGPPAAPDALESLRRCVAARWRTGVGNLWRDDNQLAFELLRRLTAVVNFGAGNVLPAWCSPGEGWQSLLDDLLDPALTAPQRSARVRAWLQTQPEFVDWVIDDAGRRGAPDEAELATLGIANLSGSGTIFSWAGLRGMELVPLQAGAAITAQSPSRLLEAPPRGDFVARMRLAVNGVAQPYTLGRIERTARTLSIPIPAGPPGVPVGPLLEDWTLPAWFAGTPEPAATVVRGRLTYEISLSAWVLELECPVTGIDPEPGVKVYLGPADAPRAILTVVPSGKMSDAVSGRTSSIRVVQRPAEGNDPARWIAWAPIPAEAAEAGLLRIGLVRSDGRGRRAAWPRPMMPWQSEPGRLAIDLTTWGGLER